MHTGQTWPTDPGHDVFATFDDWMEGFGRPLELERQAIAPNTRCTINEFIPLVSTWCGLHNATEVDAFGCPDWSTPMDIR